MLNKIWESLLHWYFRYSGLFDRKEKEGLPYFRDKLFATILILTFVFGSFSYIASAYVAIYRDEMHVFYTNTSAFCVLIFNVFSRSISFKTRKLLFSINFLLLAFMMLALLGFKGNGSMLVFVLTIIITLFSGRKHGLLALLAAAFFYLVLILSVYFQWIDLPAYKGYEVELLFVIIINDLLFNLLLVFSVSFLVNQLHSALVKENKLQLELTEKHQNVLVAKNRAEQSDKLKSAFLANMSHEIRTPMYGILGCTEFLKVYNVDDKDYQEYLEIIEESGETLLDIMTDILNISVIESGAKDVNIKTFNVNETITDIYETFLPKAKGKGLGLLVKNVIGVQDAFISSDNVKLVYILKHLVKNAIKYTEKGDVELWCERRDESYLAFRLKDNGIGIHREDFDKIFETFYQVDEQNLKALHGSGIGLSIVKAYVEMLGGDIRVESDFGIGTTFIFTIKVDLN